MHDREERLAMNEVLFRKANDRIEDSADQQAPPEREPVAFYCECSDRDCTERILIPADEFENVREHDAQFIVCPGHDVPSVEVVVTRTPLYQVVEKTGEAAEFVTEQLDDTGR
jgi:hypothetical protein